MTREEAKKIIINQWQAFLEHNIDYAGISEAYKMAMKALEQEPSEDAISREELINELKLGYFNKDLQEGKNDPCVIDAMIDWAIRTAKRLPSVTPQPEWIPVSEPPKEDGKYLVSRKNEENIWVEEAYYSTTSRTTFPKGFSIIKDNFSWRINNVIAWQNLPQPYAESEGKE